MCLAAALSDKGALSQWMNQRCGLKNVLKALKKVFLSQTLNDSRELTPTSNSSTPWGSRRMKNNKQHNNNYSCWKIWSEPVPEETQKKWLCWTKLSEVQTERLTSGVNPGVPHCPPGKSRSPLPPPLSHSILGEMIKTHQNQWNTKQNCDTNRLFHFR